MTDEHGDDSIPTPAIGPEFTSGTVDSGLKALRARLLDLTGRNRLLNFRHSPKSTLRFVHIDINDAFDRLVDGDSIPIEQVPEPPPVAGASAFPAGEETQAPKPAAAEFARSLGWQTSYDLDSAPKKQTRTLRVLHYGEPLDSICRRIESAARTAIEESGTNVLYLAFGFLEWFEADDSSEVRLAPLVTVPVALVRSLRQATTSLQPYGEDIEPNLSLVERMRRDFGIEIPTLEDEETLPAYLARVEDAIRPKRRWRIRKHLTLCLLSFGKLLMYRDLGKPQIRGHNIVRELFEGRKSDVMSHAPEYHFDEEREPRVHAPEVVLDADSSQLSALVDALEGKNLVIEGPPGTGKSQTISNLIAAALARGKTVLFVSEKLAALEVVRRRLDQAGLGMFCLELHSHKTRKHALLQDLETRIRAAGTHAIPDQIDAHARNLERIKANLRRYAKLLQHRHEPLNCSLFDLVWRRDRLLQSLENRAVVFAGLVLAKAQRWQREDLDRIESSLALCKRHLEALHARWPAISDHPWFWVTIPLSVEGMAHLRAAMFGIIEISAELRGLRTLLEESYGFELGEALGQIARGVTQLSRLPPPSNRVNPGLLVACRDAEVRSALRRFVADVQEARRAFKIVADHTDDRGDAILSGDVDQGAIAAALRRLETHGFARGCLQDVDVLLRALLETRRVLREAMSAYERVASVAGWSPPCSADAADALLMCLDLLSAAPLDDLHLRDSLFEVPGLDRLIREAADRAAAIKQRWSNLDAEFDMSVAVLAGTGVLRRHAQILASANLWQRWFGRTYREAATFCRLLSRRREKPKPRAMVRDLLAVAAAIEERNAFASDVRYKAALEHLFQGLDTDWAPLQRVAAWYVRVAGALSGVNRFGDHIKSVLFSTATESIRRIVRQISEMQVHRPPLERLRTVLTGVAEFVSGGPDPLIADVEQAIAARQHEIEAAGSVLRGIHVKEVVTFDLVRGLLRTALQYREALDRISANQTAASVLGAQVGVGQADTEAISATVDFAEEIASGGWPDRLRDAILGPNCHEHLARISELVREGHAQLSKFRDLGAVIEDLSGASDWTLPTSRPDELASRAQQALEAAEELIGWSQWLTLKAELDGDGLRQLVAPLERKEAATADLLPAFRLALWSNLTKGMFDAHGDSALLSGLSQEEMRQQFRAADKEAILLARSRAAARIAQRNVPAGNPSGPVKSWTELALIANEISKQKRHIPIRQLVRRAGHALQALKPCFLMGPLSVAQYLEPGGLTFDLVVMDEASQLRPEDAIGAIARGGQLVVVGDPKQLPPTNFFDRVIQEDDSDPERTVAQEGESILDVACALYQPVRRLRWHYRSQHESLIAFSNREFYQGRLLVFPSAHETHPELGVRYRPVRGTYENRKNPLEARALVDAVIDHMRSRSHESLGVVTLNFEQRELVEELLDRRFAEEPDAQAYLELLEGRAEPFFVKNLENVQGDERDVIFISCTYGPDGRGNQYQRFGPINGPNGHRRLNVLFTRAKRRVEVFSSLDPEKIDERGSAWGVAALKQYMIYARTGRLESPDAGGASEDSDFERSVGDVLRQERHDVVTQVGVAGFRIDLAIRNPAKPGAYVLGIECDGAAYHSGRSARDRDRLRQEILENLGWTIHRVWSTDWYHARQREVKRLQDRVRQVLESQPDYREWRDRRERHESLHGSLTKLREEIATTSPGTAAERRLLRDEILDLLIVKRPITREDWFRVVPLSFRERTELAEIRQYLTRILEIVRASSE